MNENTAVPPGAGADLPDEADEALVRRLSAADPARTAEPDVHALRAAVDARIAAGGVDQLARARARRWTSWPAKIAGVAAAALVVGGGGGYAIGASGDGTDPAAPAITLQGAPGGATEEAAAGPMTAEGGEVTGLAAPERAAMDSSYAPGFGGRTVFSSSGLSTDGGSAGAYAFDPAGVFTEEAITRVARGLGLSGTAVLQDGYWQVGPNDGTAPSLSLYPDGTASVSYYDPAMDPWSCVPSLETQPGDGGAGASGESSEGMIAPDPCTQRDLGPAPQADAAVDSARDILSAIGVDVAGYELVAEGWGDEMWSYVVAYQVVDGQRSGVQWNLSFTGGGLQSLSGALAPLVELGDYQVVSPAEAVERLTDPRFGSSWNGPIMYSEAMTGAVDDGAAESRTSEGDAGASDMSVAPAQPTLPPTMAAGSPLRWPVLEVTITGARLGLALQMQPDGSATLVPTYELTGDDGSVWSVIAVADEELDFSAS